MSMQARVGLLDAGGMLAGGTGTLAASWRQAGGRGTCIMAQQHFGPYSR
jgi:hypothetical protein